MAEQCVMERRQIDKMPPELFLRPCAYSHRDKLREELPKFMPAPDATTTITPADD